MTIFEKVLLSQKENKLILQIRVNLAIRTVNVFKGLKFQLNKDESCDFQLEINFILCVEFMVQASGQT